MKLKERIFRAAAATNLNYVVANSDWRRKRLLILCYHGVSEQDEHVWNPSLYVTPKFLNERLMWLRRQNFVILPLPQALDQLRDGNLPKRSVSVTFDDGTRDFATRALPVLVSNNVAATLYLTTYYCQYPYPVFDTALAYLLWKGRDSGADISNEAGSSQPLPVAGAAERSHAWKTIQESACRRQLSGSAKHQLLGAISHRLGIDFHAFVSSGLFQLMTPEQINSIPADLIHVELHTHRHRTPRDQPAFERELLDNQQAVAALTGNSAARQHFCYPSGDYSRQFIFWLRKHGIVSATTCVPGLASPASNPLLLPRFIDTMSVSTETFAAWASGFATFLPGRAETGR